MPTKDQLQDILSTLYVKILGYGGDSYAQSIKARKEYLSELVEMLYETKPDEVISRVLEFERKVCREEDLFNYREMLERNFNNSSSAPHFTKVRNKNSSRTTSLADHDAPLSY